MTICAPLSKKTPYDGKNNYYWESLCREAQKRTCIQSFGPNVPVTCPKCKDILEAEERLS